jgi:tetratricopeptide (TPR) repeat protein
MNRLFARALASTLLLLGGCGGGGGQRSSSLAGAVADYEAQRYSEAFTAAKWQSSSTNPQTRAEAAYLAGLSAYKLGNNDDAERYLLAACTARDASVAARANAMLGVIRLDQNREREAIVLLEKAQPNLTGRDAAEAANQLARAHRMAGTTSSAPAPSSTFTHDRVSGELFALQVGAFRSRQHAESAAAMASRQADRHGLGPMRIVPSRDDRGQTLYLVQFGSFPTRSAAATTRSRLGKLDYIVAPLAMPST